ncbi:helix-turn-helix transcriptional regulator [Agriterribacter humi]|uniref:helix-turn-helix transcriptional regulator n=1 Tax=Agriterribacter humi TaxID=1104781 RepID=UPI001264DD1C|nr:helix-turn-helix transcriptional regulator [Agriterribacter humi]
MLVLEKGIYLGTVLDAAGDEGFRIGRVSYQADGSCDDMHCHENPHISFVLTGGNVEKRKHIEFERLPGKVTFYHSGEAHQNIHKAGDSRHINIEICTSYLGNNLLDAEKINKACQAEPDIKFLILKMYKELLIDDDYSGTSIRLLMLEMLSASKHLSSTRPVWINKVQQVLNDRWNEAPTLRDLSAAAGVHPITISKHFRKYFNCTLGEYMRKLRINNSIALVQSTGTSLTDVAYECGFADQSHFTRTFKQMTSFLPKQYQRL